MHGVKDTYLEQINLYDIEGYLWEGDITWRVVLKESAQSPFHKTVNEEYMQWSLQGSYLAVYDHVTLSG